MIPGIISAAHATNAPPSMEWINATPDSGSNTSTYTFNSVSFGAPHWSRLLIVTVHWESSTGARTLTAASSTIGGVVSTDHGQDSHFGGSTGLGCAIISAAVPSGSTGTIVIDFSGSCLGCAISVFRATSLFSNTPSDTLVVRGNNDTDINGTIDIPVNGALIIAGTGSTNTTGNTIAFTGATEVYDKDYPAGTNGRIGAALETGLSLESNRTCRFNMGNISNSGTEMIAAAWRLK